MTAKKRVYTAEQIARRAAQSKAWYEAHKELTIARKKAWEAAHPDRAREYDATYRSKPEVAAKKREWRRKYMQATRGQHNAARARYRARQRSATPRWADHKQIKKLYEEASRREMHVDHIIPLISRIVCGLHVQDNLQLLTATENLRKRNKFDSDTYVHVLP